MSSKIRRARTWFTLVAASLAGSMSALSSASASAASFERLPDGRIVLTALGEKFAFREQDLDSVTLYWPEYPCKPAPAPPTQLTLAQWRADPTITACLNKVLPDDYPVGSHLSLSLKLQIRFEDGTPFPEKGKRITDPIGTSGFLFPGHISPSELPTSPRMYEIGVGVSHMGPWPAPGVLTDGPPDALGYQIHNPGKPGAFYRLSADHRLGSAARPLQVPCSDVKESFCSISISSSDTFVSAGIKWLGPNPRADWRLYDLVLRKIADSIFIARTPGDIQ